MKTTLREIKRFNPCVPGWKRLCEGLGTSDLNTEVSILQILEINGVKDAFWALRTQKYKSYCLILADVAESVLHIFEKEYPNDNRPRRAIQAIRDYKAGKISKEELEDAAYAATDAAIAAADAAIAARAARAAAYAAYAAYDADAAAYAAYAADAAAKIQRNKNEVILRSYLEGENHEN